MRARDLLPLALLVPVLMGPRIGTCSELERNLAEKEARDRAQEIAQPQLLDVTTARFELSLATPVLVSEGTLTFEEVVDTAGELAATFALVVDANGGPLDCADAQAAPCGAYPAIFEVRMYLDGATTDYRVAFPRYEEANTVQTGIFSFAYRQTDFGAPLSEHCGNDRGPCTLPVKLELSLLDAALYTKNQLGPVDVDVTTSLRCFGCTQMPSYSGALELSVPTP